MTNTSEEEKEIKTPEAEETASEETTSENEVTEEYPYILKGGLSGVKVQFYQSQLMNYKMFGKKQEEQVNTDNYFIISAKDDIDLTWYEDDYYLFEAFDYKNADYDIVYVKGKQLKEKLEQLGYRMIKYDEELYKDVTAEK